MDTTVVLQPDMQPSYTSALIYAALLILLVLFRIVFTKLRGRKKPKKKIQKAVPAPQPVVSDKSNLKKVYLKKLDDLEKELLQSGVTSRECYQQLSEIIRSFVKEAAGIDVTTKTLMEIRSMQMPGLQALIEEYYEGEFGPNGEVHGTDPQAAIEKTKKVVRSWN